MGNGVNVYSNYALFPDCIELSSTSNNLENDCNLDFDFSDDDQINQLKEICLMDETFNQTVFNALNFLCNRSPISVWQPPK